jgi:hypothetical protein
MQRFVAAAVVVVVAGLVGLAQAADKATPTGTWKWSVTRNNETVETTLKLKLEGDKLTGTITGRDNKEMPIEEATFKDGEITFKVTRDNNGQKFTMKYTGKLSEDSIKGKREFERNGEAQSRDWEAKRAKD